MDIAIPHSFSKQGTRSSFWHRVYTGYEPLITLAGATPVYLDTTQTGFIPDPAQIEQLITPKTKAIVFNYPSNPTGVTIPRQTMDDLAATLAKHDIFIISDEIYSENTFEGEHRSFAQYPELKDKLFLIHGLSKSHSMTGWRIGFLLAAAEWTKQAVKVHAYNTICASVPSQHAAICALTQCQDTPAAMNPEYIRTPRLHLHPAHQHGPPDRQTERRILHFSFY